MEKNSSQGNAINLKYFLLNKILIENCIIYLIRDKTGCIS